MAVPFLDDLRAWHANYVAQGGRRGVEVAFHEGPDDRPKRMASVVARARHAEGQLLLWESGECDTHALGTTSTGDPVQLLLRSRVLSHPDLVRSLADDLVDHVADYSAT
jgi:hypothetical protein